MYIYINNSLFSISYKYFSTLKKNNFFFLSIIFFFSAEEYLITCDLHHERINFKIEMINNCGIKTHGKFLLKKGLISRRAKYKRKYIVN